MKKNLLSFIAFLSLIVSVNAQVPNKMNYQAIARNGAGGIIANTIIGIRITITDGSGGSTLYSESHTPTTNQFGLFTLGVGTGIVISGSFSAIDWKSVNAFMEVEMDPNGGMNYTTSGVSELLSVPYALYSAKSGTSEQWISSGNNLSNANSGNVGLGIAVPLAKLDIQGGNIALNGNDLRLRDGTDGNHRLFWDSLVDGPKLYGYGGGALGGSLPDHDILNWTWDGVEGKVGIGTSTPSTALDIRDSLNSSLSGEGSLTIYNSGTGSAIYAESNGTFSVIGAAIRGVSMNGGDGVLGQASGAGYAIYGINNGGTAGRFIGDVYVQGNMSVTGTISKGGGSFKIDHPLDPENKFLYHSFVESPDMMNIYNGDVFLNSDGEAIIQMPDWFQALNNNFHYQLTCIGSYAPVYISKPIENNQFKIAGGTPNMQISWTVTGVRHDKFAEKHRIPLEVEKAPNEKGLYLHPEAFDLGPEKGFK